MLEDARAHKFNIVLCKNQSRFSRDMEIVEKYIHNLFPIWNIRFIGLVDNADTLNSAGKKSRQINGLINEWYCEDISENVKAALNIKKRNGQYLGCWCPYGYRLNRNDRHKMEIDERPADTVRRVYSLFLSGHSIRTIAERLSADKVQTPSDYKRCMGINYFNPSVKSYGNNRWSAGTVRKILKDRTYTGALVQGREKKVSYKSKKVVPVDKSQWLVVENCHEAIVSHEIFERTQKMLTVRRRTGKAEKTEFKNIFGGKAFCADCKSPMLKNTVGVRAYLRCRKGVNKLGCSLHTIRIDALNEIVLNGIRDRLRGMFEHMEIESILSVCFEPAEQNRYKKERALRRISALERSMADIYVEKSTGEITADIFDRLKERYVSEIREIEKKLEILDSELAEVGNGLNADSLINMLAGQPDFEVFNCMADRIEIGESNKGIKKIFIYWNF